MPAFCRSCLSSLLMLPALCLFNLNAQQSLAAAPTNLLIITVDDMSCDSIGAYNCPVNGTTPTIDQLASKSMKFEKAHVVVGNCMPSRNVMWSGKYPHSNGVEGFYQVPNPQHAHLVDLMQGAGYFTAIRGKVPHSTPYHPYHWDKVLDTDADGNSFHVKDASSYGKSTAMGIAAAKDAAKPFCLLINVSDPHKPFYSEVKGGVDPHVPSRVFTADEMAVPGFLFEDPVVREELALYYSSVRRADDCVKEVLNELDKAGERDNTLIVFLSDHGMPLPFAKTQVYHHSSRTPLMFSWPGHIPENSTDNQHMVSAVDLLPTILDALKIAEPEGIQGRSFAGAFKGQSLPERDFVVKEYNENSGRSRDPMRAVQTAQWLYIFNPWSNGDRVFATATSGTRTYRRMKELAETDPAIRDRHEVYLHRQPEELYNIANDPDCLHNLIADPAYATQLDSLRGTLETWMIDTDDHCLEAFQNRDNPEAMEAYVIQKEAESASRGKGANRQNNRASRSQQQLIMLQVSRTDSPQNSVTVEISHTLPKRLGPQKVQVTLKEGKSQQRVERKVVTIEGNGTTEVTFNIPETLANTRLICAAFVGEEFPQNLQYIPSVPVPMVESK